MVYRVRYMFDAGSGICFWAGNDAARERFDHPIETAKLPISENLQRRAIHICAWYDTSIDWEYPPDPSPWTLDEHERFVSASQELIRDVKVALGIVYHIVDESHLALTPPNPTTPLNP